MTTIGRCAVHEDKVTAHQLTETEQRQAEAALYPRQSTNGAGLVPGQGQELSTSRTRQGGSRKGITPRRGGGSVNHNLPLTICGFYELWTYEVA